jgi:hypothetical protein
MAQAGAVREADVKAQNAVDFADVGLFARRQGHRIGKLVLDQCLFPIALRIH